MHSDISFWQKYTVRLVLVCGHFAILWSFGNVLFDVKSVCKPLTTRLGYFFDSNVPLMSNSSNKKSETHIPLSWIKCTMLVYKLAGCKILGDVTCVIRTIIAKYFKCVSERQGCSILSCLWAHFKDGITRKSSFGFPLKFTKRGRKLNNNLTNFADGINCKGYCICKILSSI